MAKNKVGRPPTYKTVEEIQEKIDQYFAQCEGAEKVDADGNVLTDKYGEPIMFGRKPLTNKFGQPVIYGTKPPTVTGLALALGFTSRQALLNYQAKAEFVDTITRAKTRIEQYAEERLFDKDGANGAKFSLANNFEGWKEKQQIEADVNSDVNINIELID